jgi:hypothetical protein
MADLALVGSGIGDSILMKGIAEATGRSLQQIKTDMVEQGDLGMWCAR